jgi:hypothetical protein
MGLGTRVEFRGVLEEVMRRHQALRHSDELGHAPVDAADFRQRVAQDVVNQPLHGRQSNLHGSHSKKSPAVYGVPSAFGT